MRLCECGCGAAIAEARYPSWQRRYVQGHNRRKPPVIGPPCACGCGEPVTVHDGRPRTYVYGHWSRMPRRPLAERFAEKVVPATDLSPNGMAGCLLWRKPGTNGYGAIFVERGVQKPAHVVAWLLAGRAIPDGLELDHLCRRRSCVNVDHLEAVTGAENVRRGANAKLTLDQVEEIRSLVAQGWRRSDIAAAYGVSGTLIYLIRTGKAWAA